MMFDALPCAITITEVGPRDGLQNEPLPIATQDKLHFIQMLAASGLKRIELTSFVRPDAIPQLADATPLVQGLTSLALPDDITFTCLVPNLRGIEQAHALGIKHVAVFVATSDSFSKRNINATVDESFERLAPVAAFAKAHGMKLRGYLSTVFGCPYEGDVSVARVVSLTQRLIDLGCYEISLGDTIGIGTPNQVKEILEALFHASIHPSQLALHFHDTRGVALANIITGLEMGITSFDASAGGLGGCPYADGASGNVATEELVYVCERMGIATGVDLARLNAASQFILGRLGKESASKLCKILKT